MTTPQTETHEFRSEARQLLDLMIHSLYSNKEIFLRELISNSSDALDKLQFAGIENPELLADDQTLGIHIEADIEARTLTLSDNGIGMTRQEVVDNLGTIARSGTREFSAQLSELENSGQVDALIGQFGVGFYSCFMAADEVTVVTRRAGEDEATRWFSTGDGQFDVGPAERAVSGTTVILHLRDADPENGLEDFTQEWVIRQTVKKYSDFVQYPVELKVTRTEIERDEEGKPVEGAEETTTTEWVTVNSMKAIWSRSADEVTDEEYAEFYKHIAHDWEPPFETIAFKAEGTFDYQALLFIPDRPPFDLFYRDQNYGLQLYVNRVLIKDNADELVPAWLRFLKGVVDSPDLSLNVSREILQNDRRVAAIRARVTRKATQALAAILDENRERYTSFWEKYGAVIKEGTTDRDCADQVRSLLLFQSSNGDELTTLSEYVERMKEGQEHIYYLTGSSRDAVESSPHLEAFRAQGYEVLYLTDTIDEIMVGHLTEFDGKSLQSAGKGTVEFGTEDERKDAEDARKAQEETHASLLELLQDTLSEHVKEVRLSNRLTSSAACLVGDTFDMSPGLERLLRQSGQEAPDQKRILELNPDHEILNQMKAMYEADSADQQIVDYAHLLYGQAIIAEGSQLPDPAGFARRVADLMTR